MRHTDDSFAAGRDGLLRSDDVLIQRASLTFRFRRSSAITRAANSAVATRETVPVHRAKKPAGNSACIM